MEKNIKFQKGFTLIEIIVALGIFSIVAFGVYFSYANILDITAANRLKTAAAALIAEEVEVLRNLPYEDVGIVGGYPPGKLEASKTVAVGELFLTIETFVRNIDDSFDGTLGGDPNDTAPADYRLVAYRVTCPGCRGFTVPKIEFTTIAAPKGLESATNNGNLFVNAINANGDPIANAVVTVVNNGLNPTMMPFFTIFFILCLTIISVFLIFLAMSIVFILEFFKIVSKIL